MDAYLTYRTGYAYYLWGKQKNAARWLSRLLKKKWKNGDLTENLDQIAVWREQLLKKMDFYLAKNKAHPKVLRAFVGDPYYFMATLIISDYEKSKKHYQKAYQALNYFKSIHLEKSQKRLMEMKLIDLALLMKESGKVFLHCQKLVSLYDQKDDKAELEKILYHAALNLDKDYLQKKRKNEFNALQKLSGIYFDLFGQKGELSAKMVKLSAPYLKLWEMK